MPFYRFGTSMVHIRMDKRQRKKAPPACPFFVSVKGGQRVRINAMKCEACGWSVTDGVAPPAPAYCTSCDLCVPPGCAGKNSECPLGVRLPSQAALDSPSIHMPPGLSREEKRQFILDAARGVNPSTKGSSDAA